MAPKTTTSAAKPKASGTGSGHATYQDMIKDAILNLKERNGSSRQAIKKYIKANNTLPPTTDAAYASHINRALAAGEEQGVFERPKGPSGPVKLLKKAAAKPAAKPASAKPAAAKKAATKPAAKKAAPKPKTAATKKTAAKPKANASKPRKADAPAVDSKPSVVSGKTKSGRVTKTKAAAPKKAAVKKPAAKKAAPKKATPKKADAAAA